MSTFEAKVYRLTVEPHPNADKLELAGVGDYRAVVGKGQFQTGDLGVYIQEGSIVPDWLIEKLGLTGKLAGPQHNRVKAIKLRGIVSQGLIVPVEPFDRFGTTYYGVDVEPKETSWDGVRVMPVRQQHIVKEGDDVAAELGITKYEPPIPIHMSGEVFNAFGYTIKYDIENIKKYPDVLIEDEWVVMTEKLHGTWTCFGYNPNLPGYKVAAEHGIMLILQPVTNGAIVTSKGLSGDGLAFKFCDANKDNLYMRSLRSTVYSYEVGFDEDAGEDIVRRMDVIERGVKYFKGTPFYILGETFGGGVQAGFSYDLKSPAFRAFDIYLGSPGDGYYLNYEDFVLTCQALDIQFVPVIYKGPYSKAKLLEVTNGKETFSGKGVTIREGVVVKSLYERRDHELGRVQLKSVSDAYLLRGGDTTEYN